MYDNKFFRYEGEWLNGKKHGRKDVDNHRDVNVLYICSKCIYIDKIRD